MSINSIGGAANINMGVISRPVGQSEDGDNDHDNGRRVRGNHDTFRSDFRDLLKAVQSGDMTSAQAALASIQTDVASANGTYSPASVPPASSTTPAVDPTTTDSTSTDRTTTTDPSSTTTTPASSIGSDLKALFDAVGGGDASSAQAALQKFVSDRQAAWQQAKGGANAQSQPSGHVGGHHHHGHRHVGLESLVASLFSSTSSSTQTSNAPASTAPTSTDTSTASTDTTTPSDSDTAPATAAA